MSLACLPWRMGFFDVWGGHKPLVFDALAACVIALKILQTEKEGFDNEIYTYIYLYIYACIKRIAINAMIILINVRDYEILILIYRERTEIM